MKYFSIPTDFKMDTLYKIDEMNQKYKDSKVAEVYGQITDTKIISSGRPINDIPVDKFDSLANYIKECEKRNINFNYTLNSSCMSNAEFYGDNRRELIRLVDSLEQIGVKNLTVTLPSVLEIIRGTFPEIKIKASAICEIDGVTKAVFYKRLGIDKIVIDPDIVRNFKKLSDISISYQGKIEIIVNNVCMKSCPYKKFHYIHDAHDVGTQDIDNYYTNRCAMQKAERFYNPIKLNWVRPEDLKYYENVGIQYFKIQGRQNINKGNLLKTLQAYMDESYDGNLFDLITLFHPYNSFQVNIDNKKLDGFIEPFVSGKLVCTELCEKCRYCSTYAEKSIGESAANEINMKCKKFYNEYDCFMKMNVENNKSRRDSEIFVDSFDL